MLTALKSSPSTTAVSPWRAMGLTASQQATTPTSMTNMSGIKRKLPFEEEEKVEDVFPVMLGGSDTPSGNGRKKTQLHKNLEDLLTIYDYTAPHLAERCRTAYGRLKELSVAGEDLEIERMCHILELSALKGIQAYEKCEGYEERLAIQVSELMDKIKSEPVTKRLESFINKADDIVRAFSDLSTEVQNHENHLEALMDDFEDLLHGVAQSRHASEAALNEVVKRHEEMAAKSARFDKELEELIASRATNKRPGSASKFVTTTLDLLQSGDPKVVQIMQERRQACEMQRIARDEFDSRSQEADYRKLLVSLCEAASIKMDENIGESRLRGYNNRNAAVELGFEQVRAVTTQLENLIHTLGKLQSDREQAAREKLASLSQELDEHSRLYGQDEAQTQRRDLEGRIGEFNEVVRRSKLAIQSCVKKQVELWSTPGLPEPVRQHVQIRLGPVIRSLPFQEMFASDLGIFARPLTSTELVPMKTRHTPRELTGYDSDDFLETDDASSASSHPGQLLHLPMLPLLDLSPTANLELIKADDEKKPIEPQKAEGGAGCVVM